MNKKEVVWTLLYFIQQKVVEIGKGLGYIIGMSAGFGALLLSTVVGVSMVWENPVGGEGSVYNFVTSAWFGVPLYAFGLAVTLALGILAVCLTFAALCAGGEWILKNYEEARRRAKERTR